MPAGPTTTPGAAPSAAYFSVRVLRLELRQPGGHLGDRQRGRNDRDARAFATRFRQPGRARGVDPTCQPIGVTVGVEGTVSRRGLANT